MILRRHPAQLLAVLAAGCGPAAVADGAGSVLGRWRSEGYGYLIEIGPDTLRAFEVTAISCLPSFVALPVAPAEGATAAFRLTEAPVTLLMRSDSPGKVRLHVNGTASDLILRRADVRPAGCDEPPGDTPPANLEIFARTFEEHYPFFALKGVDWPAVVAEHRARVSDSTTPAELFTLLQRMIAPLEDAHTGIRAADLDRRYHGRRNGPHRLEESQFAEAYALAGRYLAGPLRRWCNGQVEFGMLRPDVGYLRIRSFGGYTAEGSFESGLAALEAALDTVFAGAASWRGLVTDVRINGGGADPYGLAIAARLATRAYQAYAKQARSDPGDPTRWTDPQPSLVRPTSRPGFGGPVVHLIGIHSLSAAETFTQALINREPAVKFVGEPTQGVFSDVLSRRLPNGWRFWLPNERFVTNGRAYDGPGIPPHVEVPVFAAADRRAGRDRALERALELLDRRQKEAP